MEITPEKEEVKEEEQEKVSDSIWLERQSFRIVLTSTFAALAVVLGYMLVALPNIELFTMTIFLSGFILGKRDGAIVGIFSSFIFCFFNPVGTSPLPLLAFQLTFYSFDGFIGGVTADFLNKRKFFKPEEDLFVFPVMFTFGLIGGILIFIFDIFSTVLLALSIFGTLDAFWPNYIIGLPFTTLHLIFNILAFVFILPALIQLIYRLLDISSDD